MTLKKLAIDLITPSFLEHCGNPAAAPVQASAAEVLKLLGTLSEISKQSFGLKTPPQSAPITAPTAAPMVAPVSPRTASPSTPQIQAPRSTPHSGLGYSRNAEYRPALQNPDIVRALMGIERDRSAPPPEIMDSSQFRHVEVPIVEAQPKPRTAYTRTSGYSTPVLRSE